MYPWTARRNRIARLLYPWTANWATESPTNDGYLLAKSKTSFEHPFRYLAKRKFKRHKVSKRLCRCSMWFASYMWLASASMSTIVSTTNMSLLSVFHQRSIGTPSTLYRYSTNALSALHQRSTGIPPTLYRRSTNALSALHQRSIGIPPTLDTTINARYSINALSALHQRPIDKTRTRTSLPRSRQTLPSSGIHSTIPAGMWSFPYAPIFSCR